LHHFLIQSGHSDWVPAKKLIDLPEAAAAAIERLSAENEAMAVLLNKIGSEAEHWYPSVMENELPVWIATKPFEQTLMARFSMADIKRAADLARTTLKGADQ
jgi:hypothetical protein